MQAFELARTNAQRQTFSRVWRELTGGDHLIEEALNCERFNAGVIVCSWALRVSEVMKAVMGRAEASEQQHFAENILSLYKAVMYIHAFCVRRGNSQMHATFSSIATKKLMDAGVLMCQVFSHMRLTDVVPLPTADGALQNAPYWTGWPMATVTVARETRGRRGLKH